MLTSSGKLFHVDFGFMLGRDPKPLPPPVKITRDMIETMGGLVVINILCCLKVTYLKKQEVV